LGFFSFLQHRLASPRLHARCALTKTGAVPITNEMSPIAGEAEIGSLRREREREWGFNCPPPRQADGRARENRVRRGLRPRERGFVGTRVLPFSVYVADTRARSTTPRLVFCDVSGGAPSIRHSAHRPLIASDAHTLKGKGGCMQKHRICARLPTLRWPFYAFIVTIRGQVRTYIPSVGCGPPLFHSHPHSHGRTKRIGTDSPEKVTSGRAADIRLGN
jgi:hypothetical protein